MPKKLTGRALAKFEAERNIWQEVLDGVREIKADGGKRVTIEARSPIVRACGSASLTEISCRVNGVTARKSLANHL